MKTAEIVKIKIEKLDDDLSGVAFRGGKKYVVAKTLPDEDLVRGEKKKRKRRNLRRKRNP